MFTLLFIMALAGAPVKTIVFDGFRTLALCEEAKKIVIQEVDSELIFALVCVTAGGKSA